MSWEIGSLCTTRQHGLFRWHTQLELISGSPPLPTITSIWSQVQTHGRLPTYTKLWRSVPSLLRLLGSFRNVSLWLRLGNPWQLGENRELSSRASANSHKEPLQELPVNKTQNCRNGASIHSIIRVKGIKWTWIQLWLLFSCQLPYLRLARLFRI